MMPASSLERLAAEAKAKLDEYRSEPHQIDAALEVTNAITDLIEA